MIAIRLPAPLLNLASVVSKRHLSSCARATYSASYVLAQPRRSATRQASAVNVLWRRAWTGAAASLSTAIVANSGEISLRHRSSCRTEDASDHIKWGATNSSRRKSSKPVSDRHAVTTQVASMTSNSVADPRRANSSYNMGHGFSGGGLFPPGRKRKRLLVADAR